ncbi:MAG: hypothetical protein CMM44_01970 [Rhodospirillaceae bacterium]|nr:hypothetical protein [Rhodospirillaceae bacterium]|tara:strand:+ start:2369 stop:2734 length:366 start_codon:yes stop_codon:yes gene_type:complete
MKNFNEELKIEDQGAGTILCALDDLNNPGSKGFTVGQRPRLFVVRIGNSIFGYFNICPHRGTPLDWKPNMFLTRNSDSILCATHGALFTIEKGMCIQGPCKGTLLSPIRIKLENGLIKLID